MRARTAGVSLSARLLWGGAWGAVCVLVLAAPILSSHARATAGTALYLCFSGFCHQIPERSLFLYGYPLAVCHRCFGFYLGLCFGSIGAIPFRHRLPNGYRTLVIIAGALFLLDALLPLAGLWRSTGFSRMITGLLLGYVISSIAVRGVSEWLREFRSPSLAFGPLRRKGDLV